MAKIFYGKFFPRLAFVTCVVGWLGAGCASYITQARNISQSFGTGNFQLAATQISAGAEKHDNTKDGVVWRLEQGAVLRTAGKLEESNHAFDLAEEKINRFEEQAKVKVSRETLATVTNLTMLPYEGFAYDKIMMNTYKALNYMELGDYEKARVELNRAYKRQEDAVHINSARIEKAQAEGKTRNLNVDLDRVNNDPRFSGQFNSAYANLEQYKPYADYVNPLAVYLDGLFFMSQSTGSSDLERSRKSFERVLGMIGENKFIRQDIETIQQIISGQPFPPTTYVIFETGMAPEREEVRIDLPLFIVTSGVPYVGAAFPRLKYRGNYLSSLNVSYNGTTELTLLLTSMDAIVAHEFKNVLPLITTKTLIASAIKAGTVYGESVAASGGRKEDSIAGLAVLIAGAVYQVAMNQADLRTWTTLPKEFQLCRFPTPADRKIEISAPYGGQKIPVTINDGLVNVVWVKSVNQGSPLLIKQFKLKDDTQVLAATTPPEAATPSDILQTNPAQPEPPSQTGTATPERSIQAPQSEPVQPEQLTQISSQDAAQPGQTSQGQQPELSQSEQSTQKSDQVNEPDKIQQQ